MLKLSIVLPTYNSGEFLEQALLSIFNQTCKNIELIIIDGKSTDNTVDIIKKYESIIHFWTSEKDSNAADATNKALKHVTGDVITFFGADDYYIDTTALDQITNEFENNPRLDLLFSNINSINRKTDEIISLVKNDAELFASFNRHDDSIIQHIKVGYFTGLVFAGMSVRTSSMANFQFDISNVAPDYDFILHMWKNGCFFHYIDHPLINVRQGGVSYTAKSVVLSKDKFLVNKRYFGFLMAVKLHPWLLHFPFIISLMQFKMSFIRYLHSVGFRPLFWLRKIRSILSRVVRKTRRILKNIALNLFPNISTQHKFRKIYKQNLFLGNDSRSGQGSGLDQTAEICKELPMVLQEFNIKTMLDAPCGDWFWMSRVDLGDVDYTGMDIVPELIASNTAKYGTPLRKFKMINLINSPIPKVDLIFCRDCLVHLSFEQSKAILHNFKKSGSTYLLITTFPARTINTDPGKGFWEPLNLQIAPFNLPEPLRLINEHCTEANNQFTDKSLALYRLSDI